MNAARSAALLALVARTSDPTLLAGVRATAVKLELEEEWARAPIQFVRGNRRIVLTQPSALVLDKSGATVGVDAVIRVYDDGVEVLVDQHRRIVNPPFKVPDGTFDGVGRRNLRVDPLAAFEEELFHSVRVAPAPELYGTNGTVDTFNGGSPDVRWGDASCRSTTYATAADGGGTFATQFNGGGGGKVGQDYNTITASNRTCIEAWIPFNTATISDTDVVSAVVFSLYGYLDHSTTNFTINVAVDYPGATLTTASFRTRAQLAALTVLATRATSGWAASAWQDFTSTGSFPAAVSLTGFTHLLLYSSRHAAGTGPTQAEWVEFYSQGAGGGLEPKLVVTHTPTIDALTDNFDDNSIDTAKWVNNGGAQIAEVNSNLELTSTLAAAYYAFTSVNTYRLTGKAASVEIVSVGNQALASFEFYPLIITLDGSNDLHFIVNSGDIMARKKIAGTSTWLGGQAYSAATHKYVRIREATGTTYWDYSADGTTWLNLASALNPIAVTAIKADFIVGTWQAEAATGTGKVDNYNIIPTTAPLTVSRPTLKWNVQNKVATSRTLQWNVQNKVTVSRPTLKWNVQNKVTVSRPTLKWNVQNKVAASRTIRWQNQNKVATNRTVKWNTSAKVLDALTALWNVQNEVALSRTLQWSVASRISATVIRTLLWATGGPVVVSRTVQWNTSQRLALPLTAKWTVQNKVALSRTLPFTAQQRLAIARTIKWATHTRITLGFTTKWTVQNKVALSRTLHFATHQRLTLSRTIRWTSRQRLAVPVALKWTVNHRETATRALTLQFAVAPGETRVALALSGVAAPVAYSFAYETRNRMGQYKSDITDYVLSADFDGNNDREIVKVANFVFVPDASLPINYATDYVYWTAKLRVDGSEIALPIGMFSLLLPSNTYKTTHKEQAVKAAGMAAVLAADGCISPYTVAAGTVAITQCRAICDALGLRHSFVNSTKTLGVAMTFDGGTTWLEIINALLHAINYYSLWDTNEGIITSRPSEDLAYTAPAVAYDDLSYVLVNDISEARDTSLPANRIVAVTKDTTRAALVAVAVNADPNSPLSTVTLGRTITKRYETEAADQATLTAIAAQHLRDEADLYTRASISTSFDPRRDAREVYELNIEDAGYTGKWRQRTWKFKAETGAIMEHDLSQVLPVVVT